MATSINARIENPPAVYDGLADLYDIYWRGLPAKFMPALDELLLRRLPRHARVLDLCCGSGRLSACLCRRGLRVTGLDGSIDMVRLARDNVARAQFVVGDARAFRFAAGFDAVVSTGDSMNHMIVRDDLSRAFACVFDALLPDGTFVFDMNMAEAFGTEWRNESTVVASDHLLYVRGRYDKREKLGCTYVTTFNNDGEWLRHDATMFQRCYPAADVKRALLETGFTGVRAHAAKSLGMRGRLAVGRTFFVARRPL